jgi:hypothetical protein
MLLIEGFSNAQRRTIMAHIASERERIIAFAEKIREIFNNQILGDEDGPAQWRLPMDEQGKNVGIICLDNNRIRKIIDNFQLLIQASISDPTRLTQYSYCIPQYRMGMEILRQREDFMDDRVKQFQEHIDQWYQTWLKLHGWEGCTNYTHMLSSAHIAEYMFKWKNMYRFSQQGWESFNHVFSTFYFRRTNHGGIRHGGAAKSKLLGIGCWLQRRMLWMVGVGTELFSSNDNDADDC